MDEYGLIADGKFSVVRIARAFSNKYRRFGDHEDVFQSACLGILEAYERDKDCTASYLFQSARNGIKIHVRRRKRFKEHAQLRPAPEGYDDPDYVVAECVREAVDKLPPTLREVIRMSFWGGYTPEEIAAMRGVKPKTIWTQKWEAIDRLKGLLGDLYED